MKQEYSQTENEKIIKLTYDELFSLLKRAWIDGCSSSEMIDAGLEQYNPDDYAKYVLHKLKIK